MNINKLTNCVRIGAFKLNEKSDVKKNLNFIKDTKLLSKDYKKNDARVYFITINDKIVKIGGSNAKGGIAGTIQPYCSGNSGRPSDRTFGVNYFIEQELRNNKKVEIYCQWMPAAKISVPSLTTKVFRKVSYCYKAMEEECIKEYLNRNNGVHPILNLQEGKKQWPKNIQKARQRLLEGGRNEK